MIEKIRERNRVRLVTAAFSGRFLRQPDPIELAYWLSNYQSNPDLKSLLAQLTLESKDYRGTSVELEPKLQPANGHTFDATNKLAFQTIGQNKVDSWAKMLGRISLSDTNLVLNEGDSCRIQVQVENHTDAIWETCEETPIYLSYHWYLEDGTIYLRDGKRTALAMPIGPGETVELDLNVQAPDQLGNFLLELTMIMEGEFWFEERDFGFSRVAVKIATPRLSPYALKIYKEIESSIARCKPQDI